MSGWLEASLSSLGSTLGITYVRSSRTSKNQGLGRFRNLPDVSASIASALGCSEDSEPNSNNPRRGSEGYGGDKILPEISSENATMAAVEHCQQQCGINACRRPPPKVIIHYRLGVVKE